MEFDFETENCELIRLYQSKCEEVQNLYDLNSKLEKKLEARKFMITRLRLESEVVQSSSQANNEKYIRLVDEYNQLEKKYTELKNDYNYCINDYQMKYQNVCQELIEVKEELEKAKAIERPKEKVHIISNKVIKPRKEKRKQSKQSEKQNDGLQLEYKLLKDEFEKLQKKYEQILLKQDEKERNNKEVEELEERLLAKQLELDDVTKNLNKLLKEKNELSDKNNNLHQNITELKKKLTKTQDELNSIKIEYNLTLEELKQENNILNSEIVNLRRNIEEINETPTDTLIGDIFDDMIFRPKILSPLYEDSDYKDDNTITISTILELKKCIENCILPCCDKNFKDDDLSIKDEALSRQLSPNNFMETKEVEMDQSENFDNSAFSDQICDENSDLPMFVSSPLNSPAASPRKEDNLEPTYHKKESKLIAIRKSLRLLNKRQSTIPNNNLLINNSDDSPVIKRKRIAHTPKKIDKPIVPSELKNDDSFSNNDDAPLPNISPTVPLLTELPASPPPSPICRLQDDSELLLETQLTSKSDNILDLVQEDDYISPQSPPVSDQLSDSTTVRVIPLEPVKEMSQAKMQFLMQKLINYSTDDAALAHVINEFRTQKSYFIAQVIVANVMKDTDGELSQDHPYGPLLTNIQKILLGFMVALSKNGVDRIFRDFITVAEKKLLTASVTVIDNHLSLVDIKKLISLTRLYVAILRYNKDLCKLRLFACELFYFQNELALPIFYTILTSWCELLPKETESRDILLARVLVQCVYIKVCKDETIVYYLKLLRQFFTSYYEYPTERWDNNTLFQLLFDEHKRNPSQLTDFTLLLLCKNSEEKWVYTKVQECFIPLVDEISMDEFKASVILLIGNLVRPFTNLDNVNSIQEWFKKLLENSDSLPDIVKKSIYLSIKRLVTRKRNKV